MTKKKETAFEAMYNWLMLNYPKIFGAVVYTASIIFILATLTNTLRV